MSEPAPTPFRPDDQEIVTRHNNGHMFRIRVDQPDGDGLDAIDAQFRRWLAAEE